jgi:hypothetical protein
MKPLFEFKAFDQPKLGVFRVETGEYTLPVGWVKKEEEITIIGETDDSFVYKLVPSGHGEWGVGDTVVQHNYILPIGVHKSRFVRWNSQLNLFSL